MLPPTCRRREWRRTHANAITVPDQPRHEHCFASSYGPTWTGRGRGMPMNARVSVHGALLMVATVVAACEQAAAPAPPAPPEVYVGTVVQVVQQDVPIYLDLVGQTEGSQDVDVRARVEGFLDSMDFREGSFVRKGELLYMIDPKPYQAALAGSKADKATAQARLDKADT